MMLLQIREPEEKGGREGAYEKRGERMSSRTSLYMAPTFRGLGLLAAYVLILVFAVLFCPGHRNRAEEDLRVESEPLRPHALVLP